MKILSNRNYQRFLYHHSALAIICGISLLALYSMVQSNDVKFRWSLATGYVGIALLGATLVTGALNILRNRRNPISTDLRRDIGIWCGIMSLVHVVIGLQIHMGSMLLYFFREAGSLKPRVDLFGFANYVGLIATFVIVLLLALSNDFSLRRLGKKRWKFLQRWNYVAAVLITIHSIAYQIIESRTVAYLVLFGTIVGVTLIFQFAGFRYHSSKIAKSNF